MSKMQYIHAGLIPMVLITRDHWINNSWVIFDLVTRQRGAHGPFSSVAILTWEEIDV